MRTCSKGCNTDDRVPTCSLPWWLDSDPAAASVPTTPDPQPETDPEREAIQRDQLIDDDLNPPEDTDDWPDESRGMLAADYFRLARSSRLHNLECLASRPADRIVACCRHGVAMDESVGESERQRLLNRPTSDIIAEWHQGIERGRQQLTNDATITD